MDSLKNKRVITAALTGAFPTKEMTSAVPYTPEEIAKDAYECWKAGAAVVHIHVRRPDGTPCNDLELFEETVEKIRAYEDCDVCINLTSSGSGGLTDEDRIMPIRTLLPELASYDIGSLNWQGDIIFENHPLFLKKLAGAMSECNVKPECEIFDAGMIYNAKRYIKEGILKEPCHFQIVLGAIGGMDATVDNLVFLKNLLPENCTWAACGIGKAHLPIMMSTIALGGHLRVGLEDNIMWQKGVLAESNAALVKRAKQLLEINGLEAATPDEARQIYGLTRKKI